MWVMVLALGLGGWMGTAQAQRGVAAERVRRARAAELVARGARHRDAGDLGSALGFFREAVDVWPGGVTPYAALGDAYLDRGSAADALAAFEAGLRRRPGALVLLLGRARALRALGRHDEAAATLRRATTREPSSVEAWRMRAELAQVRGAWTEALNAWRVLRHVGDEPTREAAESAIAALRVLVGDSDVEGIAGDASPVGRALAARRGGDPQR